MDGAETMNPAGSHGNERRAIALGNGHRPAVGWSPDERTRCTVARPAPAAIEIPRTALEAGGARGEGGLTDALVATVAQALADHELIKVKFEALKDQKKSLAPELATRTGSRMIQRVGNVVVLFKRHPEVAHRKVTLPDA